MSYSDPVKDEKRQKMLELLAEARAKVDEAAVIADDIGEGFDFLESSYRPKVVTTTTTGGWDFDDPNEWQGSQC